MGTPVKRNLTVDDAQKSVQLLKSVLRRKELTILRFRSGCDDHDQIRNHPVSGIVDLEE